jgi:hypothetical protein
MNNKIDLTPAILDLVLYAGDGEDFQLSFIDENKEPIDVSALLWTAQIRKTRKSEIASELEILTTDAAIGIITIHISAEITRALPTTGQWDLQCAPTIDADPLTILQGSVSCIMDVTRVQVEVP